jgi:aminoglycoside 6'-N-acetyltransferase I
MDNRNFETIKIVDLRPSDETAIQQIAELLVEAFREHWPEAWPDLESALQEVQESFESDRISRVALDDSGAVLGWIGGIRQYEGHVWELHPLVVKPSYQGQGIGRALVSDLEAQVRERGGLTLWLGTDDEDNMTTLAGVNLYPNIWEHVARIKNLRRHPYEFYQKLGFVIIGVLPDANGLGKPDIYMAKPLHRPQTAPPPQPFP